MWYVISTEYMILLTQTYEQCWLTQKMHLHAKFYKHSRNQTNRNMFTSHVVQN